MAGLAAAAAGLHAGQTGRGRVGSAGVGWGGGRGRVVGVVLGSSPGSDRSLLPPAKPWLAHVAEGRRALAQPRDLAWGLDAHQPRPELVALRLRVAMSARNRPFDPFAGFHTTAVPAPPTFHPFLAGTPGIRGEGSKF